ncbi:MAG TPA: heparan-alpha-glucosaminide N-acetyltransferase domain-containing protein [Candidatus Limnocylindria bacterium]|nr:heparan-alpha-glucosaminide N-acetyltransferase domain-containing protein [Candidatus Limnocylindria bacterium]
MSAVPQQAIDVLPASPVLRPRPVRLRGPGRLLGVDAWRGLALVLMSLDHAAYYAGSHIQAEHFADFPSELPVWGFRLVGLITNLAAPTFWLVSGVSIALLIPSLRIRGGGEWAVTRYLWIRAGCLALLDVAVVPWLWSKPPVPTYEYSFGLLSSFAVSLILISGLRFLRLRYFMAVSIALVIGYQWLAGIITPAMLKDWGLASSLWTRYGTPGHTPHTLGVPFPVLGWFGLMGCGYVFGKRLYADRGRHPRHWAALGLGLLATWLVVRVLRSYGNTVPISYHGDWSELITMYKGPVSLAFLCFNAGWGCLGFALLLRLSRQLSDRPLRWLVALGQASLFTFIAHLLVYRTLGRIELKFMPHAEVFRYATTFIAGLALLVPMARWYAGLKRRHPRSVLQYL